MVASCKWMLIVELIVFVFLESLVSSLMTFIKKNKIKICLNQSLVLSL